MEILSIMATMQVIRPTQHFLQCCADRNFSCPTIDTIFRGYIFEYARSGNKIVKFGVRCTYDDRRDGVYILAHDGWLLTGWLNEKKDRHQTMDLEIYEKEGEKVYKEAVKTTLPNGETKLIGYKIGNTLTLFRNENKHLYRGGFPTIKQAREMNVAAWAIDCDTLDKAIAEGINTIRLQIGKEYLVCPASHFLTKGFVRHFHRAIKPQYFLSEVHFKKLSNTKQDKICAV